MTIAKLGFLCESKGGKTPPPLIFMTIEIVYWRDIAGISEHWQTKDELMVEAEKVYKEECVTIGEVIYETDDYIIICATFDGDERYHDASVIMKSVIIRRELWTRDGN